MRFDVLTLFPDMFEAVLGDSIIGRARENGLIDEFYAYSNDVLPNSPMKSIDIEKIKEVTISTKQKS